MPNKRKGIGKNTRKSSRNPSKTGPDKLNSLILKLVAANPDKKYDARQIREKINVDNNHDSMEHALAQLVNRGLLIHKENKYHWNKANSNFAISDASPRKTFTGRVDMTRSGSGYIVVDGLGYDIYVPINAMKNAMHRDIVKVEVPDKKNSRKVEGKVVDIVSRSLTNIIGTLRIFHQYAIVFPIPGSTFPEVLIKLKDIGEAKDGQYVLAEIITWGSSQNKAIWGKVNNILHEASLNDVAMESILISNGFSLEFPETVMKEAEAINGKITAKDLAERRDYRKILTFTIDPATARDFDDALSYRVLENGNEEVGVHIADVTHFMQENSALDKEALSRSTSVYLVDRVLPMLPEKLSNDLCSLNPKEDKFTFSAVFEFDEKHKIVSEWFGKTIIHSSRRFSYEEAQERLETKKGDLAMELLKVDVIAKHLRKLRFKNGSINFESDEIRFELDAQNKPIGVFIKERKDSNMLIEDFMLLANKSVATFMHKKSRNPIPFVYRVHDMPDPTKLADFALFAKELGYQMNIDTPKNIAKSFNELAEASVKNETLRMLEPLAIRTMAKAEYTTENIGHYGLAFDYYTHFTSPIRRYSDVLVHRILFQNLKEEVRVEKESLEIKCKHISQQERKAMDAERDSIKYKQVEYMMNKIDQEFIGRISGMIDRGFFVEIGDSKAEGMIPFNHLDEPYILADNKLKAVARRSGKELKMGSMVKVRLDDADLDTRKLEFTLLEVL